MTETLQKIADDLVKLKPGDRIELAEALITSVPAFADERTARAWEDEIDRRLDESEAGRAEVIPTEESFAPVRKMLREARRPSLQGRR
ncbi:MAG: addiction module protein [Verrucomicrobia bacterium]|nr:addiction module protein [Verrucomicrobiota bacterium]